MLIYVTLFYFRVMLPKVMPPRRAPLKKLHLHGFRMLAVLIFLPDSFYFLLESVSPLLVYDFCLPHGRLGLQ